MFCLFESKSLSIYLWYAEPFPVLPEQFYCYYAWIIALCSEVERLSEFHYMKKKSKAKCAPFKTLNYVSLRCFYCAENSLRCETSSWRNRLKFAWAIVWSTEKTTERPFFMFLPWNSWMTLCKGCWECSYSAFLFEPFASWEIYLYKRIFFKLTKFLSMPVIIVFSRKQKYEMPCFSR